MKQTLYLLRHAKSEPWSPGINDFNRSLNDRGHNHMARLSEWARSHLEMPSAVLCSAATRTRETLDPFLDIWPGLKDVTRYEEEIYEASTGMLHDLAGEAFETASIVLMIGHNPGFEYLAMSVIDDMTANSINKMATGTLAVIDFPDGYEEDCGMGELRHWVKRKDLPED
jgi:phosphohistidine phosphatase